MQRGEYDVGTLVREERQQRGIGIAQHDAMPGSGQRVGDTSAGTKRHVALMRDPAGENDDVQRVGFAHDQGFLHYLRSEGGADS